MGELSHNLHSHGCFKGPPEKRLFSHRIDGYSWTSFTGKRGLQTANPRMLCRLQEEWGRIHVRGVIATSQRPPPAQSIPREDSCTPRAAVSEDTTLLKEKQLLSLIHLTNDDCATRVKPHLHSSMVTTLFWHQPVPKQRENKCKCINTKHTAIRRWYIFIFRCRQANCKDVEVFLCFHGILGFCTRDALFVGVASSHCC